MPAVDEKVKQIIVEQLQVDEAEVTFCLHSDCSPSIALV